MFHRTLKKHLWPHELESFREAEAVIRKVFADYRRIHSSLAYSTPRAFASRWRVRNNEKKSGRG